MTTSTLTIDVSKVPDLEKRKQYLELWEKEKALEKERDALGEPMYAEIDAASNRLYQEYETKSDEAEAQIKAKHADVVERTKTLGAQIEALENQRHALGLDIRTAWVRGTSLPVVCALTGLVMLQHDNGFRSREREEWVLRDVLPLAPVPAEDDEDEEEDDTDSEAETSVAA